jgi:hypothetical protein
VKLPHVGELLLEGLHITLDRLLLSGLPALGCLTELLEFRHADFEAVDAPLKFGRGDCDHGGQHPSDLPARNFPEIDSVWIAGAEADLSPPIAQMLPPLDARRGNEIPEAGGIDGKLVLVA